MNSIIEYLKMGCKKRGAPFQLGLELEHFTVNKHTKESIPYLGENGVESILQGIKDKFDDAVYSEGHLISLIRPELTITIEPAAQLEVSIMPKENPEEILSVYYDFLEEIDSELDRADAMLVTKGYQPVSRVDELERIPKKRYEYMEEYFEHTGSHGVYMMKGTAAIHVSIDYFSEEDCMRKYRLAGFLSPLFGLYMENTPVFEGVPYEGHLLRRQIWDDTDEKRVFPGEFFENDEMTFSGYANFVMNTPLILDISSGEDKKTEKTAAEIYQDKPMSTRDVEHVLGMVFPDIRLKQYIEIRSADSNDAKRTKQYLYLIRHIFSSENRVMQWLEYFSAYHYSDIRQAERKIMQNGRDAVVYGKLAEDWMKKFDSLVSEWSLE